MEKVEETSAPSPIPCPVQSPDFWYTDAELVFRAESCLFRVHGAPLKSTSPVFSDMLTFPQPNPPEDIYAGCTLVCLPDSAHDIGCFFRAIFIPGYFEPPPARTDFGTVLALLRMGHKYDVPSLCWSALSHLATAYPTSLEAWDNRAATRTFLQADKFDDEFQLLQAVLKADAQWAMPALFYTCCTYPMKEILLSVQWKDGGDIMEKYKCLLGYVAQFATTSQVLQFLVQRPTEECRTRERCYTGRLDWVGMAATWKASYPLDIWDESNWKAFSQDVCSVCLSQSKVAHRKARQVVWSNLPRGFGLPVWVDLEVAKALAIGA